MGIKGYPAVGICPICGFMYPALGVNGPAGAPEYPALGADCSCPAGAAEYPALGVNCPAWADTSLMAALPGVLCAHAQGGLPQHGEVPLHLESPRGAA